MRRPLQFRLRTLLIAFALASVLAAYVGIYARLYQRGLREQAESQLAGFLYVGMSEAEATRDLVEHHRRARLFAPVNWVHHELFKAERPTLCILWELE